MLKSAFKRKPTDDTGAIVGRINELSRAARTSWFGLLGYLAFVGVTLLGVADADFFIPARQTQLPLINVSIPTRSFFIVGPVLGLALFTYLHLQLMKLWSALGEARHDIGAAALLTRVTPWLINDLGMTVGERKIVRARPLQLLSNLVTFGLVWIATWAILFYFWWRSLPAHEEILTLGIGLCLAMSVYVGLVSFVEFARSMALARITRHRLVVVSGTALTLLLLPLGWMYTESSISSYFPKFKDPAFMAIQRVYLPMAGADLRRVEFAPKPGDWRNPETHFRRFLAQWCKDKDTRDHCISSLAQEWNEERAALVDQVDKIDLKGRDLRLANLSDSFLAGADLYGARLNWATLENAQLEGADLRRANMVGAILTNARLERTRLSGAELSGAFLEGARFTGATLSGANFEAVLARGSDFEGSDLRRAKLTYSDLSGASLVRANLEDAHLEGAALAKADLSGASMINTILTRANLSDAQATGAKFYGTNLSGAEMRGIVAHQSNFQAADLTDARLQGAFLGGVTIEQTNATGAALAGISLTRSQVLGLTIIGASFGEIDGKGAMIADTTLYNLVARGVSFDKIRLQGSKMIFADLRDTVFSDSFWGKSSILSSLVQGADFRGATDLTQATFDNVIGDETTLLPGHLAPDTGEPFYVNSCMIHRAPGIDGLLNNYAIHAGISYREARETLICAPGVKPERTGSVTP